MLRQKHVKKKITTWRFRSKPQEFREREAYRQLMREVVFGLFFQKRELLAQRRMQSQPVSIHEIFAEVKERIKLKQGCGKWPYPVRSERWMRIRLDECTNPEFYDDGVPKLVAVAGKFEPNPALFKKPLEVQA